MASRNSFLDNIDLPSSQRRKVERVRRESGFRGGSGGSSIRRETRAEREQRERQTRLSNLQKELSEKNVRLTQEEAQAILSGKSVSEIRQQVSSRTRRQALRDLQRDLSSVDAKLSEADAQKILRGESVSKIRETAFSRAEKERLARQEREQRLEAAKAKAVQDVRLRQIANRFVDKQEAARNPNLNDKKTSGIITSQQEVREQRLEQLTQDFQRAGFNEEASKDFALAELGTERIDNIRPISAGTPNLGREVLRRAEILASGGAGAIFFSASGVAKDPQGTAAALGVVAQQLKYPSTRRKLFRDIRTGAERNPVAATIDIVTGAKAVTSFVSSAGDAAVAGTRALDDFLPKTRLEAQIRTDTAIKVAGSKAQGRLQAVDEILQEATGLNLNRRGQVKNPNKRTKSKAQIRKESLNQAFNPNVNIDPNKVTAKTGRARKSRQSIEAVDPNTVRIIDDKRGARTGFGTPQDKTTLTLRNNQGQRSIDLQKQVGFVQGQAKELGGKAFSRPASQVQVPKGFDPNIQAIDVGNQKIIAEQLLVQRQQSSRVFDVQKRQPRTRQDPNLPNPANVGDGQVQILKQGTTDVSKQPRATPRGQRPQSKREARFQALKARLGRKRREQSQPDIFVDQQALPNQFKNVGDLFTEAETISNLQRASRAVERAKTGLVPEIRVRGSEAFSVRPAIASDVNTDFSVKSSLDVSQEQSISQDADIIPATTFRTNRVISSSQEILPASAVDEDQKIKPRSTSRQKIDLDTSSPLTPNVRTPLETPRPPSKRKPPEKFDIPEPRIPRVPTQRLFSPEPKRPRTPFVPPIPRFGDKESDDRFRVVVGKRDNVVFRDFGVGGLELVNQAKNFVRNTAAASLTIKPVTGKSRFRLREKDFRRSKSRKNTFVERREKRISTEGELQDITFKSLLGRRKGGSSGVRFF